jgi:hypothetical protein
MMTKLITRKKLALITSNLSQECQSLAHFKVSKSTTSKNFKSSFLLLLVLFSSNSLFAQPTQVEGTWRNIDASYNSDIGSVTARTAVNSATVLFYRNQSLPTSGTRALLFNNPSDNYNPKWVADNATLLSKNTRISTGAKYHTSGGTDINFATVQNSFYTFIIGNNANSSNDLAILETSYDPVSISSVARDITTVFGGQSPTITVTMASALNTNERLYLYYSIDGFATAVNSTFVQISSLNGSFQGTASIPTFANGTTVTYYVLTTANTTPTFTDVQYQSLNIFNGTAQNTNAANASYTVQAWQTATAGNWSTPATWTANATPPTATSMGPVTIAHNTTLDQAAIVGALTINGATTLTGSDGAARTLTIAASGSITNNGTFTATANSTVSFAGTGTINGTISFNNLTVNGVVGLSNATTVSGNLQINTGGAISLNTPIYTSTSTLIYNTTANPYGVNLEWTGNTTAVGAGVPQNVTIQNTNTVTMPTTSRGLAGNLTIAAGTFTLSGTNGSNLSIGGNFTNNATFISNGRLVTFAAPATIAGSTATTFSSVTLNGTTTFTTQPTINAILTVNPGSSVVSNSPTFGAASTLVYARSGTVGLEWPTTSAPNNVTLTASIGTITLNGAKQVNGILTINAGATLDVSASNFGLTIGSGGTFTNNGTFNAQTGAVTFNGNAIISGTASISLNNFSFANGATLTMNNSIVASGGFSMGSGVSYTFAFGGTSNTFTCGAIATNGSNTLTITGTGSPAAPFITSSALTIANGTSLSLGTSSKSLQVNGAVTIDNGGGLTLSSSFGGDIYLTGDFTNNGTFTHNTRAVFFNGSGSTQTILGSNFNNSGSAATNCFAFLFVRNTNAVTLGVSIHVNSRIDLLSGKLILGNNTCTLNTANTSANSITNVTASNYIQTNGTGRFVQSVSTSSVTFAVGNAAYNPLILTLNSGTDALGVLVNDAAPSVGSINNSNALVNRNWSVTRSTTNGSTLAITTQWNATEEGSQFVRTSTNRYIGVYNGTSWNTNSPATGGSNPYTYATSSAISISTNTTLIIGCGSDDVFSNTIPVITDFSPTTGSVGSSVTITGRNLTGATATNVKFITVSSSSIVSNDGTTLIAIVGSGTAASGTITVNNGSATATSAANFTYIVGKVTVQNGDWSNPATWGGTIPLASDGTIVIFHAVTLSDDRGAFASSNLIISGGSLLTSNSGQVTMGSYSNNGTINMTTGGTLTVYNGGTFINNGTFIRGAGKISFVNGGSFNGVIDLNDVDIAGGLSFANTATIYGTLLMNNNAFISNNPPVYATGSTLQYNATSYNRNSEWGSNTSGAGYPHHVVVNSGCTVNLDQNGGNSQQRQCAGNLTVNGTLNLGTNSVPLLVLGDASVSGTLILATNFGGDLKVGGNFAMNGNFTPNNRAVFFNKTAGTQTISASSGSLTIPYVLIDGSTGVHTVQLNNTNLALTAPNGGNVLNFSNANDVLDLNGKNLTIGTAGQNANIVGTGTFKGNSASNFTLQGTTSTGTITFSNDLNVKDFTVNLTGVGGTTLGSDVTVNGTLNLTAGSVNASGRVLTFVGGVTPIARTNGTIITNATSDLLFNTAPYSSDTFTIPAATFNPAPSIRNFTLNNNGKTLLLSQSVTVNTVANLSAGTLAIGAGNTLTLNGASLTTISGSLTGSSTSDVTVSGTTGGTVTLPNSISLQNVSLSGTRTLALNGTNDLTLHGALNIQSGTTFDNGGESQIIQGGSGTIAISGTFITRDVNGFMGANTSIPTIVPVLNSVSNVEYAGANQMVTHHNFGVAPNTYSYQNLTISGTGTKTLQHATETFVNENLNIVASKLLLNSGEVITVRQAVNSVGELELKNNAQLIQIDETDTNLGTNVKVERIAQAVTLDYVYWSSPLENFAVSNLPNSNRYFWNPTVTNSNGTQGNWQSASGNMTKGKGYIARASNGEATPTDLPVVFQGGKPHNGTFTTPIERGNYTGADYDAEPSNPNNVLTTNWDDNWNLVGNPYPSAINAIAFLNANTNIEGFVNIWTHQTLPTSNTDPFYQNFGYNYTVNDYITYNATGISSGPSGFGGAIASGQGFFVLMNDGAASSSTVTFTNAMRRDALANLNYNNTQFYRNADATVTQTEAIEKNRIWLDIVSTDGNANRTLIGYVTNATNDKDRLYDVVTQYSNQLKIYSYLNATDDQEFLIQGRSLPFDGNDTVKIGVSIPSNGNYSIAIAAVDGLFNESQDIYIQDNVLNTIHNIKQAPYSFLSNAGNFTERFVLRYSMSALNNSDFSALDNSVFVSGNQGILTVKSSLETLKSVQIFDILGRQILNESTLSGFYYTNNVLPKTNQTLIIKVLLANGFRVTKKIVF